MNGIKLFVFYQNFDIICITLEICKIVSLQTAHRADALLKEIDKTYVGYINQKIQSGLQTSFKLQKIIKGENAIVRGYM